MVTKRGMRRLALIPLLLFITGISARADVASSRSGSLETKINGVLGGRCSSGLCLISGGSDIGRNRFHRLSEFDTRGAIEGVSVDSDGVRNLVLGVTALDGSFIDKSVRLSSPAHLFVLSPGGIQLTPGASFQQIPQLTLSTAKQLRFAGGVFDVLSTPIGVIPALGGDPLPGALGLLPGELSENRPLIRMEGVSIDVDESLWVDSPGGRIDVLSSKLSLSNSAGDGGSLTLTGDLVMVGEGVQLLATGTGQGGLVQVGGSWQNSDQTVRQASQTWIHPGSVVDASSTVAGDGGTVVIWSDLNNPSGGTVAEGTLLARGGMINGDGGRIETSGSFLMAEPELLDVTATNGLTGKWLLDPYVITIAAGAGTADINPVPAGGGQLFESTASKSRINSNDIETQLRAGTNVEIATGAGGAEGGNITWEAGASIDYSNKAASLTLDAHGYIYLKSDITTGSGGLVLEAGAGYVKSDAISLSLNGPLDISTGDANIGTIGFASPEFAASLTGSKDLTKSGNGRLILTGDSNTWSGTTNVQGGFLRVVNSNALGTSASTKLLANAALEIDGGISLSENIELNTDSSLVNVSGNNVVTQPVLLKSNANIDLQAGTLTLSPATANGVSAQVGTTPTLTILGSGDLVLQKAINLGNQLKPENSTAFGVFSQEGSGLVEFKDSLHVSTLKSTGGGKVWLNQIDGAPVSSVLSSTNSIYLDNSSILRRDRTETVNGVSLQLGPKGGGIEVGNGFTLDWDSTISGTGAFTKAGEGTLRFPSTANITYTGKTKVTGGRLEVYSSMPITATCIGTGSSALCGSSSSTTKQIAGRSTATIADQRNTILSSLDVQGSEYSSANFAEPITDESQTLDAGLKEGFDGTTDASNATDSVIADVPLVPVKTQVLAPEQAAEQFQQTDEASTSRMADFLEIDKSEQMILPASPTVEDLKIILSRIQRDDLAPKPAVLQVRFTRLALSSVGVDRQEIVSLIPQGFGQLNSSADANLYVSEEFSAQAFTKHADVHLYANANRDIKAGSLFGASALSEVTQASNGQKEDAFLDLTLIGADTPLEARRVPLNRARFISLLKALYRQLSRQEPLKIDDPASPSRQLHALLVAPILESLQGQNVETLLIAADQGLQAVPFAALSDGKSFLGDSYAFGLTPSLALTQLASSQSPKGRQLVLGASEFENLAPLPLVPQELEQVVASSDGADRYLNEEFSPQTLLNGAADLRYDRVHVATHADFRPGGASQSVLQTGTGPMSMAQLAELRNRRNETPLDLIVLSACRTLLGDPDSELGFAGLALQAGARSAVGTLWYVDDVVTSAFFVQFYRLLHQGLTKAEALQRTRQLFISGNIQLDGDSVIGADEDPLLTDLTPAQRLRIAGGIQHPYFWSGIELIGSPW